MSINTTAQEKSTDIVTETRTIEQNHPINFDGNWSISNDENEYIVKGTSISNHSDKRSPRLTLHIYLANEEELKNYDFNKKNELSNLNLGRIAGNGSKINNVQIRFNAQQLSKFEDGVYYPILHLNRNLSEIKVLNAIEIKNGQLKNYQKTEEIITATPYQVSATKKEQVYEFKKIERLLDYPKVVELKGDLALKIDYKNLNVSLIGEEAQLRNITQNTSKPVRLRVSLLKDFVLGGNADGYNIAEFILDKIEGETAMSNFNLQTKLLNLIPDGTYTPMIQVVEEENDRYIYNSMYIFQEKFDVNKKP